MDANCRSFTRARRRSILSCQTMSHSAQARSLSSQRAQFSDAIRWKLPVQFPPFSCTVAPIPLSLPRSTRTARSTRGYTQLRPVPVVALFGTGLGRTTSDGFLAEHLEAYGPGGPGGGMEILYAGVAPGLAGVQQVNVRVHPNTPLGDSPPYVALIRVVFGSAATFERTQDKVGIWVGAP